MMVTVEVSFVARTLSLELRSPAFQLGSRDTLAYCGGGEGGREVVVVLGMGWLPA